MLNPRNRHTETISGIVPTFEGTGRERLIRTRLIRSSTQFEVFVKSLPDSYHFMFRNNG